MSETLLVGAFLAALSYTLIPGPAFLALLGIGAGQGRRAGALFMGGHLAGDILWSTMALVAIVGARSIGTTIFDVLGLICGAYLAWIGWTALNAQPTGEDRALLAVERPLRRGLVFGLTNPKGYPVALATFTALLAGSANALEFNALPMLLAVSLIGFLLADVILIAIIGASVVRRFYRRHELTIVRLSGLVFIAFAAQAVWHAAPGLFGVRRP
ncbi:LysE family translocator [Sinorhizobium alkalisoli]|uniref:Lysine transporter LysE n=1 Tax=Sinorhizobium alkalisoli TaxID=1752398 RepID=A0A1E3VBM4_9HYPH|nr:LysE family translocator [Sinorhizobium alkalisoli]MCA1493310.1 LysE family translocator [Ensifer sp. NBAIM29]MCG5479675.1 LysE family translocator [Sinorhizobium alkalisoli]ODR90980.1 lysine transporter LysE [Sinorhizobium alkalisoli]QFI68113.1 Threonine efflux protein [Sinorhizobium alkalisoli]